MQKPFVSVVIPVLNAARYLEELLVALRLQSYPKERFEVIIVDNGSDDGTAEILEGREGITLLRQTELKTPYASRNMGIEASRGEIIALADANKIPDPAWLEEGVEALMAGGADLAGGEILFDIPDGAGIGEITDAITFNNNRDYVTREGSSAAGNLFFRRKVWEATGPFPVDYRSGMDIWWSRRALAKGFRMIFAEKAVVRCKPRKGFGVVRKSFRVGLVHPITLMQNGMSKPAVFMHSLLTFLPPRPSEIRNKLRNNGIRNGWFKVVHVWGMAWLVKIGMGCGRLRGFWSG
ncbi:MAG: glycosyltransferase [Balneolaceae bacterium]